MKKTMLTLAACSLVASAWGARPAKEFRLWPGGAPGAKGDGPRDIPTLTPSWPAPGKATGAVMVVLPGGGYGGLAGHEGRGYAQWLSSHGITAFVLKYRLGSAGYRHPVMLRDVSRAIRTVRANAKSWGVDPGRIGVMGSSAGGHLASTILVHFDKGKPVAADPVERASSRPDLGVLCYPVITMGEQTHRGSRKNLLGPEPSPELVKLLSNELQVKADTPSCFIWHTAEDQAVKVENSLLFAAGLREKKIPFALHVYQKGRHGIGLGGPPGSYHPWTRDLLFWLKQQRFLD